MLIIDAHLDIAANMLAIGRDYTASVAETRQREGQRLEDIATVGLAEALTAEVGLVFGTLFVAPESGSNFSPLIYRTPEEAQQQALAQLAAYHKLAMRPDVMMVENQRDLSQLLAARAQGVPMQGIVVLMEGADPILVPTDAAAWFVRGVRIVGPAWKQTRYSGGTGDPGPLTALGRELMGAMQAAGLALDVSHMAEASFWQALDLFAGPVLASHANCRALVPNTRPDRHLSDAMLTALLERDAVIGTVLYNKFLQDYWTLDAGKAAVTLDTVVQHIDHICQLAGDARHVGIGSDLDGGFGVEGIPLEIDTIGDLPLIATALARHGYRSADIAAIMGGNWLRMLERVLPL